MLITTISRQITTAACVLQSPNAKLQASMLITTIICQITKAAWILQSHNVTLQT